MRYISDKLTSTIHEVSNYSDMFAVLKDSINNLEVVHEEKTWTTSLCLEAINGDSIGLYEFQKTSLKELEDACELLVSLRDYLDDLTVDPSNVHPSDVPNEFFHFFNINKNTAFYSAMLSVKPADRKMKKKKTKSKSKMLF